MLHVNGSVHMEFFYEKWVEGKAIYIIVKCIMIKNIFYLDLSFL